MKTTCMISLLTLSSVAGAFAQTQQVVTIPPKPATIKLGLFMPSDSGVKGLVGKNWFAVGADYVFPSAFTGTVAPLAYIDYTNKSKSYTIINGASSFSVNPKINTIGVGVGLRAYLNPVTDVSSIAPYVGLGVGAYFNNITAANTLSQGGVTGVDTSSTNKTSFGFKLNVGVEFQKTYVIEAAYTHPGTVSGVDLSGYDVYAGYRF